MRLIDTDHLSVLLEMRSEQHKRLVDRLRSSTDEICLSIVTFEEQLRGWLAKIHSTSDVQDQVVPYLRLQRLIEFVKEWRVISWNERTAEIFQQLRRQRIRIGTFDLKLAAIAIAHDASVLSSNLRDFEQVPGLKVEDWLHR